MANGEDVTLGQQLQAAPAAPRVPGQRLPNLALFLIPGFAQGYMSTRRRLEGIQRSIAARSSFQKFADALKIPRKLRGAYLDQLAEEHEAATGQAVSSVLIDMFKKAGEDEAPLLQQLLGPALAGMDPENLIALAGDAGKAVDMALKSFEFRRAEAARQRLAGEPEGEDFEPELAEAEREEFFRSPEAAPPGTVQGPPVESPEGPHPLTFEPQLQDPLEGLIQERDRLEVDLTRVPEQSRPGFTARLNRVNSQIFGLVFARRLRELRQERPDANVRDLQQQAALETTSALGIQPPERFQLFLAERPQVPKVGVDRDAIALELYNDTFANLDKEQREAVNARVRAERKQLAPAEAEEVKERQRRARRLPKDIQAVTGQQTVGAAEDAGFSIPEDPKLLQEFRSQRAFTEEAIRRIKRIQSVLTSRPEAHGTSGALAAAAEGLAAQVINFARILGVEPSASRNVNDYRAVFSEIGVTNRVLQSQTLGLAFLAAAAEGLRGRELTDRKIELLLRRIGGAATQSPQAYASVLEQFKREIDFRLQAEGEGIFGQKPGSLLPALGAQYDTPEAVRDAYNRNELDEDEAVKILRDRFGERFE
jgi:hypothetical protein